MSKLDLKSVVVPKVSDVMTLEEYLEAAKKDASLYASPHERLLKAIGPPRLVDTREDQRLGRIHNNAVIKVYDTFADFHGIERVIEQIVAFVTYAAQGLEESRQILYLLGPVSGGKSQLAERIKELMCKEPFYALAIKDSRGEIVISPIHENPLGLFNKSHADALKIPARYLTGIHSPWATKRIKEFNYDLSKFYVVKLHPDIHELLAVAKVEPGDANTQDITTLVGKIDLRKLELFGQDDPDAYSYSGGLCRGNRGTVEFVEMFKAPKDLLLPLLTATQEKNYTGTEPGMGAIPVDAMIIAHSNESEWDKFRGNKDNEAFLDRTRIIKVPYVLQSDEIAKVQLKLIGESKLVNAPIAPHTMDIVAKFLALTRISNPENSNIFHKMKVYNGEDIKSTEPTAKSLMDYKDNAAPNEGMFGVSNRAAQGVLAKTFNQDVEEVAANPVHLIYQLGNYIDATVSDKNVRDLYHAFLKEYITPEYIDILGKEISITYLEAGKEYGQDLFDRYVYYANAYDQKVDYRDPETGELLDYEALDKWLSQIERKVSGAGAKDFRGEVVKFCLRYKNEHKGKNPPWDCYIPMKEVIEANIFRSTADLMPVIAFGKKSNKDDEKKHKDFVDRMKSKGYTEKQVRLLVDWWNKAKKVS